MNFRCLQKTLQSIKHLRMATLCISYSVWMICYYLCVAMCRKRSHCHIPIKRKKIKRYSVFCSGFLVGWFSVVVFFGFQVVLNCNLFLKYYSILIVSLWCTSFKVNICSRKKSNFFFLAYLIRTDKCSFAFLISAIFQ